MRIQIDRRSALPLSEQIVAQVELLILAGEVLAEDRLPSVRGLARQLRTDRGTVYAAYQKLQENGNLELRRGSGAFVRRGERPPDPHPASVEDALLGAARLALRSPRPRDMRRVAGAWLEGQSIRDAVAVDAYLPTAELMAAEVGPLLEQPVRPLELADVERHPDLLCGRITLALHLHVSALLALEPRPFVVAVSLDSGSAHARQVAGLPAGSSVLVVSHSARVLPYARAYVEGMRGDEVLIRCHLLPERREWTRHAATADLVVADAVSFREVQGLRPDAQVLRLLEPGIVSKLRDAFGGGAGPRRLSAVGR
jgi:DNA-binding transcriptional regulator YhcF (GntR family)